MAKIPNPRDIILAPVVSEKSYGLMEENTYVFFVAKTANKTEIKIAIEQIFGVQVASVNTVNREGKRKRTRTGGYGTRFVRAAIPSTSSAAPLHKKKVEV